MFKASSVELSCTAALIAELGEPGSPWQCEWSYNTSWIWFSTVVTVWKDMVFCCCEHHYRR